MLRWAVLFLICGLVFAALGFTGIAVFKVLFAVFTAMFVGCLIADGLLRNLGDS